MLEFGSRRIYGYASVKDPRVQVQHDRRLKADASVILFAYTIRSGVARPVEV